MAFESVDALAGSHVPEFASLVDRTRHAVLSGEVKLGARELGCVAFECVDAFAGLDVPDLGSIVEGAGQDLVAVRVEVKTDDLGSMPLEREHFLA